MDKKNLIIFGVIVLLAGYFWSFYNKFVSLDEGINAQWAQVESQYQRRLDLIPNLVETVKGAMAQEQTIFKDLADARAKYSGAKTIDQKAEAATQVEGALSRLLVVMENYPQLTSMQTVNTLMVQLEGTENRIAVERQRYNEKVQEFNASIKKVPNNLIASLFGFSEKTYFESQEEAQNAPKVDLSK
ncbi:MAG TPA: LemA family protein [Candidatus Pacearchaeota archaeon]|nr:LemA family protein [Candidatus Parcubacteria bacterium]HNZ84199.1 LemA family protein [Candidatus Pacearchaeota archaeon]HOU46112.1 LemA family protein [Candidatus Pacearchaeota archaeon]HPM08653.1 LemA family protein [Candidatus Pacearchaeota archaeon]HQI74672.1 LemA family protein [Candidatus Pacearchaeota archaeon]